MSIDKPEIRSPLSSRPKKINALKRIYWAARRMVLKAAVPEFIWPAKVILNDVDIPVRGQPWSFGVKRSIVRGTYEQHERSLICAELHPNDRVVEFGCSIGILTRIVAKRILPNGQIISVEADERLADKARRLLQDTDNAKVVTGFAFPVSQLNPQVSVTKFETSGGSLGGTVSYSFDANAETAMPKTLIDIARITQQYEIEPSVFICDVEGSEEILLHQRMGLPKSIRLFMIELHPSIYGKDVAQQIQGVIKNDGFRLKKKSSDVFIFERS